MKETGISGGTSHPQHQQAAVGQEACESCGSSSLRQKCIQAVSKQGAKVYIALRCIAMLLCWRDDD